jgi:hypothetical protein
LTNSTEKAVLSSQDTLKEVIDCLTEHISIKTQGACNQTDLFNILVAAASFFRYHRKYSLKFFKVWLRQEY